MFSFSPSSWSPSGPPTIPVIHWVLVLCQTLYSGFVHTSRVNSHTTFDIGSVSPVLLVGKLRYWEVLGHLPVYFKKWLPFSLMF